MKLTKSRLKQLIKEELKEAFGGAGPSSPPPVGLKAKPDVQPGLGSKLAGTAVPPSEKCAALQAEYDELFDAAAAIHKEQWALGKDMERNTKSDALYYQQQWMQSNPKKAARMRTLSTQERKLHKQMQTIRVDNQECADPTKGQHAPVHAYHRGWKYQEPRNMTDEDFRNEKARALRRNPQHAIDANFHAGKRPWQEGQALTKSKLKRIIKEELDALDTSVNDTPGAEFEMVPDADRNVEKMDLELERYINDAGSFDKAGLTQAAIKLLDKYAGSGFEDAAWEIINRRRQAAE